MQINTNLSLKRLRIYFLSKRMFWVRTAIFMYDVFSITMAWFLAFLLRFNFEMPEQFWQIALRLAGPVLLIQGAVILYFRLDRIVPRFIGPPDFVRILRAAVTSTVTTGLLLFFTTTPKSVFITDFFMLTAFMAGGRFFYRFYQEGFTSPHDGLRTLIVGAGRAGEFLVRDLIRKGQDSYWPVGFIDDDRSKFGKEIHGIRIMGRTRDIPLIVRRLDIEMVILAIPTANPKNLKRITELCQEANVPCRIVPSLEKLITGRVTIDALRDVTIEDILGREPVRLDWATIRQEITGKVILVSGAGGSIGGELSRQIAKLNPALLILVENNEYALYQIEMDIKEEYNPVLHKAILCDIRQADALEEIFAQHKPSIVFHAAAYKHVPMVELNPAAGIETNVFGTKNIADIAAKHGVKKFIFISTDKAVRPTNVMGASKRIAEMYCQSLNEQSETVFITTRFGNVLESSGSVVPLFKKQVRQGGPITVTHPEIKRYFMTTQEACQLVLQAASIGRGGEIFVLDMGEPVKILDLAEQIIRLHGLSPYTDIDIVFSGLRPGEKLFEELFYPDENLIATSHPKILLARKHTASDWLWLNTQLKRLTLCAKEPVKLKGCIKSIVSDYQCADELETGARTETSKKKAVIAFPAKSNYPV